MRIGSFDLRNLKQRDIAIIFIVLSVIGAALWYVYLYRPTQDTIAVLELDIADLDQQIQRGEEARRNLPALQLAVEELEADRRAFLAQLPLESEVAALLDQLRTTAATNDVVIATVSQAGAQEAIQGVRPIGFSIATEGTFVETMGFLDRLEALERFTKIRQVSLSKDDDTDDPALNANFNFTVYVFTGEDPGPGDR